MYISELAISNFRGLKDCRLNLNSLVCIVGENNAGKSSLLLAMDLFLSPATLSFSDFFQKDNPIRIEVTFSNVLPNDLERIPDFEARQRISGLLVNNSLRLVRLFNPGEKPELLCFRPEPIDVRLKSTTVDVLLKGKKGKEIIETMQLHLPEYAASFVAITTQGAAKDIVEEIISELPPEGLEVKEAPLPTGIPNSIKPLLPEPIFIPAVKDAKDEIKTAKESTFGKLIAIILQLIERTEQLQSVTKSLDELHKLLNKVLTRRLYI